ncbi:Lrp/AsnC family transcriptional regulator [Candidatus Pacearchaeota archaeon]|nr:Lrp/AsnC family transcriptional regulator [Candidatus Pacearchaeota archaeon]
MKKLSKTERKVLDALVEDSSKRFSEIARELKISRQAVAYNVTSLKKKNIIKRFTVDVDYTKLEIGLPVLLFVKMEHVNIATFKEIMEIESLMENPAVQDVFTLSGVYAFGVFGWWKDKEEYACWKTTLIEQMKEIKSNGPISIYELDEYSIWDFYKHRGIFEVPSNILEHLKEKKP